MNENKKSCLGCTKISEDVLIEISENAVNEIDGVRVSGKKRRGLFGGSGISLKVVGGVAEITVPVVMDYGCKTVQCTEQVQSNIKNSIQDMTGIAVSKVNVLVDRLS